MEEQARESAMTWALARWKPLLATTVLIVAIAASRIDTMSVLVNGLQVGAVYSLIALGLALVFKATRVLNFAQGVLGSVPAFVVFVMLGGRPSYGVGEGVDLDPSTVSALDLVGATIVAMIVGAGFAILINVLIIERLANATPVTTLVATVGVTFLVIPLQIILFGVRGWQFPRFIDGAPCLDMVDGACATPFAIGGTVVTWHTIIVILVLTAAAGALAVFFRTPVGVALLATAQEPYAAELQGVSTKQMSILAWAAGGALAALGGVLGGGVFESIQPGFMTQAFLIPAIIAAVLGGITSMPGAVLGGLLLGVSVAFANNAVLEYDLGSAIPGPPQVMTIAVLLLVLLLRPRGLLGKEA